MISSGYIAPEQLKKLSQVRPWRTVWALAFDWLVIVVAISLSVWSGTWWAYIAAIMVVASRQHALATIMHDLVHYRFIKNRRVTAWIADLVIAWPLFATFNGYKVNHLDHHKHLNTDDDPDWTAKLGRLEFTFPQEINFAIFNLLGYLICVSSFRDLRNIQKRLSKNDNADPSYKTARLSFYAALAIALTYAGGWILFFTYWIVPYLTFFLMFNYIRSVAEHFGETLDHSHDLGGTRTVLASPLETFFLAPHNVHYHLEHHSFPSVPFYNLPELHRILMDNPEFAAKAHITRGFIKGLWQEVAVSYSPQPSSSSSCI